MKGVYSYSRPEKHHIFKNIIICPNDELLSVVVLADNIEETEKDGQHIFVYDRYEIETAYYDGIEVDIENNFDEWVQRGIAAEKEAEERQRRDDQYRTDIESASAIAFVALAQDERLDDMLIIEHPTLFSEWSEQWTGKAGTILIDPDDGGFYRSIHDVGAGQNTLPSKTPAMWTRIGDPQEEWPEWIQPIGAHDAYDLGAKVSHNNKHRVSTHDSNVWEPGVYGWEEAE